MTDQNRSGVSTGKTGEAQTTYCYISCDSDANSRASAICREIRALGGEYRHDNGKLSGDEWAKKTTECINGCHAFVLLVTKGMLSRENRFVRNEFFFAKKSGRAMYAVMLDKIYPEDVDVNLKKWFDEINELCRIITPPSGSSPADIAGLMNEAIDFAPQPSEAPSVSDPPESGDQPETTADADENQGQMEARFAKKKSKEEKPQDSKSQKSGKTKIIIGSVAVGVIILALGAFWVISNLFISNDPENFTYEIMGKGVIITSLTDDELTSVKIPQKIEGKPVVKIGEAAFSGCAHLKKIIIPDTVKEIEPFAFLFCEELNDVRIPDSVVSIGESAFSDCTGLTSVTIPDGVTQIGASAFQGCTALRSVKIADSVKVIDESAFMNCTDLKKINIPDSVMTLGGGAFEGCTSLSEVELPEKIAEIGFSSFEGCAQLKEIVIPGSVKEIGDYAFSGCSSLKKAVIPESVDNIVDTAFADCPELTIYGKAGSCAEEYAQAHDISFKAQ